jgi:hypothetical protein
LQEKLLRHVPYTVERLHCHFAKNKLIVAVKSLSKKKYKQEQTVSKDKEKKRGRKSKTLPPPPAQEVDVPLVVGSVSCSPSIGINANDSSIGQSIGMSSNEDATMGEDNVARDTKDDLI